VDGGKVYNNCYWLGRYKDSWEDIMKDYLLSVLVGLIILAMYIIVILGGLLAIGWVMAMCVTIAFG